ncbi:MAG TPA: hypothetical protein VFJ92_03620 [Gemmatimonadales bacterium]|nr:hypothetical protein [Gemmatimonadales bacterium]
MTHRGLLTDAHDRLAAELADDYLIEEELGRGASATVFLAQDLRHGRRAGGDARPRRLRAHPAGGRGVGGS